MTNLKNVLAKATGFTHGQEVDIWYGLLKSLYTLCAKLDADGTVNDTDYTANCWTAFFSCRIEDTSGNTIMNAASSENFFDIRPGLITDEARHWLMYWFSAAIYTLTAQLDADTGVADTTYEANCYTAMFLQIVVDPKGVTNYGNGTTYYFTPGYCDRKMLLEWLYNAYNAIETLTEQLDLDGTVTDTNYEALTYTVYQLINVENAAGNSLGNG